MKLLVILSLLIFLSGCTTINYHMNGELFLRCQKGLLDKNYTCETVNERRFKEDL